MTREELAECLDFDLFEGDFGEPGDTELTNKIVKGQQKYICFICDGPIQPGEIHRYATWKFGEIRTYRCCNECCIAMVHSVNCDYLDSDDGEDPINVRYALGETRRNGEPA